MTSRSRSGAGAPPDLKLRLREARRPLTPQRRVIAEWLAGRVDHPTADQVFAAVRDRLPGLSRATVYRVLETLVGAGAVRRLDHPGSSARFDPRADRHHHLVCLRCGTVVDFEASRQERPIFPDPRKTGFEVRDYSIHFTGICSRCRERGTGRETNRTPAASIRRRPVSRTTEERGGHR